MPPSGARIVVRMRTAVVLPAPLGPSSPKMVPSSTAKLTPSRARTSPPKVFFRSWASMALVTSPVLSRGRGPRRGSTCHSSIPSSDFDSTSSMSVRVHSSSASTRAVMYSNSTKNNRGTPCAAIMSRDRATLCEVHLEVLAADLEELARPGRASVPVTGTTPPRIAGIPCSGR